MTRTSLRRIGLIGVVLAAAIVVSVGQAEAEYRLEAWVMGSAGSSSFTVGEPAVGRSSGGGYENCAGFWCVARGIDQAFSAYVTFAPGLNLFGMPVATPAVYNAQNLLADVLLPGEMGEARRYNGSIYEVGTPTGGVNFDIADAEGYLLYMGSGKTVKFTGAKTCTALNLVPGLNVVTIPCASATLTSYSLMSQLGTAAISIMRFNALSGSFETVSYDGASIVGSDFEIKRGEAYLVNMNAPVTGFTPTL